jgi:hypothetical protein
MVGFPVRIAADYTLGASMNSLRRPVPFDEYLDDEEQPLRSSSRKIFKQPSCWLNAP